VDHAGASLLSRMRAAVDSRAIRAAGLARRLARHSPGAHLAGSRERANGLVGRLIRLRPILIERPRKAAETAGRVFARERALLARRRGEAARAIERLTVQLGRAFAEAAAGRRARFAAAAQLLDAVSYRAVLARGFALVRDERGAPLRRATEVRAAQPIEIEFADGKVPGIAGEGATATAMGSATAPIAPPSAVKRARSRDGAEGQGSLF